MVGPPRLSGVVVRPLKFIVIAHACSFASLVPSKGSRARATPASLRIQIGARTCAIGIFPGKADAAAHR